jgi:S1-C subfamily serine protease
VTVRAPGGAALAARVVARDERTDVALLAVPGLPRPAPLARGHAPAGHVVLRRDGSRLPVADVRRIDARIRAGDGRLLARRPALALRAAIGAGDSGAPVLGPDGRVAGVVFARSRERPGTGYAVAASALDGLLP